MSERHPRPPAIATREEPDASDKPTTTGEEALSPRVKSRYLTSAGLRVRTGSSPRSPRSSPQMTRNSILLHQPGLAIKKSLGVAPGDLLLFFDVLSGLELESS